MSRRSSPHALFLLFFAGAWGCGARTELEDDFDGGALLARDVGVAVSGRDAGAPIDAAPRAVARRAVAFLVDTSSSMNFADPRDMTGHTSLERALLRAFERLRTAAPAGSLAIATGSFGVDAQVRTPCREGCFSTDVDVVRATTPELFERGDMAQLALAITLGGTLIEGDLASLLEGATHLHPTRFRVVLITDSGPSESERAGLVAAAREFARRTASLAEEDASLEIVRIGIGTGDARADALLADAAAAGRGSLHVLDVVRPDSLLPLLD